MSYQILTEQSIPAYLKTLPHVQALIGTDELEVKEIGDGNVNYVFVVTNKLDPAKSIIIKQAVPYLRCIGESYALSRDRMHYEITSLKTFHRYAPHHIPEIYHADTEMSLFVMQYLRDHIIMRKGLMQQKKYSYFTEHMSNFLAETLFKTSSLYLSGAEKRALMKDFNNNSELCAITENFVFTFPFMEHETNRMLKEMQPYAIELSQDQEFKQQVLQLKYQFMNQTDALLHGDLHTGSIMVNADETYVIDSEFAFFGPFGFDTGALLANLVLSYVSHAVQGADKDYLNWLLHTMTDFMTQFERKFLALWNAQNDSALFTSGFVDDEGFKRYQQQFMKKIFQETVGYAGCKMARRLFGVAGVADTREIENIETRLQVELYALEIAKTFVKEYKKMSTIDDIKAVIAELSPIKQ